MANWKIDASHSEVGFKVKHLMITNVSGVFTRFEGTVRTESEDFHDARITFEADVSSVTTNNQQRDEHLRSADFFDSAQFPRIRFVSRQVKKVSGEHYRLIGDLTIRDETHTIELSVTYNGTTHDAQGHARAGFELDGRLHRSDYGLRWSATTDTGGLILGDEVKLHMNIQIVQEVGVAANV
ncbi:YceI family protein [Chitinophaga japonensis]|uniref:Polyisoprenoid-binding protein YceI n=1 Tax=Chitinophaga japonensis TaxID=104662 RepID=A0A562TFS0_CHIJA|nr:YceI family protein [Chitinophaga japonensis]TWI92114.1 polyisoprenoid-binding protein YceI [Chitinophaga japonensis]